MSGEKEMKFVACHDMQPIQKDADDHHGYCIYPHSPLGMAMLRARAECQNDETQSERWVLVEDQFEKSMMGGLSKKGPCGKVAGKRYFSAILNVGKEWVFRTLFSLGDECVGADTVATHQAFQTRLKYMKDSDRFIVYTQLSGCKDNKTYAMNVKHQHCFCVNSEGIQSKFNKLSKDPKIMAKEATDQFVDDLKDAMKNAIEASKHAGHLALASEHTSDMKAQIGGVIAEYEGGNTLKVTEESDEEQVPVTSEAFLGAQLLNKTFMN